MISELSSLFSRVSTYTKPEDILLKKGGWVHFSDQWPDTHRWAKGCVFRVKNQPILVPYAVTRTLPESDYVDIDLSNAAGGLLLYPESEGVLYQTAVGFKPGNYVVHTYIPSGKYVYNLAYPSMYPDVTSATLRYLGAKEYADSPYTAPLWHLYFIKDMPAFILRLYALAGVEFERITLVFKINKCVLEKIENPTAEMLDKSLLVQYYPEMTGY